jgi:PIN domain nuclease of toxin-antitoxin system
VLGWIGSQGFAPLDISVLHAQRAGGLAGDHRDPFDRMLIAQAQLEDVRLISDDHVLDEYGVRRIW